LLNSDEVTTTRTRLLLAGATAWEVLAAKPDELRSILEARLLGPAHVICQARPRMADGSITLMSGLYASRQAPALIDTLLWDAFGARREAMVVWAVRLLVGRIDRPEELAEAVLFLMCNGSVTGTVLAIDGGGLV
jgi:NAD(P)-dependent dehydrogenase (short-subunit alcohol dehydrogenase family)